MFEIFILSFVQGITEFLPVSSSSHLIIISKILNFKLQSLLLDVSLHIGSFLAIIYYFKNDLILFYKKKIFFLLILVSSLPVIIIGFIIVKLNLIDKIRAIEIIGWMTIIFGAILYISDRFKSKNTIRNNFNLKSALIIGFVQALALIPGVSRSGVVITISRFLGYNRIDAAKISFYLSIPTLAAVSLYGFYEISKLPEFKISQLNLISISLSFLFSYITIKWFLMYLKKYNLNIFIMYRIILGVIILTYAYI